MRTRVIGGVLALGVVLATASVRAHHSFSAEFDANLPVTLTGIITKVERTNPHGWIFMDVTLPDGKIVNWAIETGGPLQLARRGISRDVIAQGMLVVVRGYRAKDGSATANGDDIRLPDGRHLFIGGATGDAPYVERTREANPPAQR